MMMPESVIRWLLQGDPAIRWQTLRDLTDADPQRIELERNLVKSEGWGKRLLECQDSDGLWAGGLYTPKWKSTTYTMLLLRDLGFPRGHARIDQACKQLLDGGFNHDCGINYSKNLNCSETCITGMVLSILSYFHYKDDRLHLLTKHLLERQMPDGGWNCQSVAGATHGSFHTTISVLEGLLEYQRLNPPHTDRVEESQSRAREFFRVHRHFRSHRTGLVVDDRMTRFSFPPRWHYDILRGLDYFQNSRAKPDSRDEEAVALIRKKQTKDGVWQLQNRHPGKTFFEMEKPGEPSRWNTLRALRVLRWFEAE